MNLYSLLKIYTKIKNPRFRAMGMLLLHLLRRKYTCMFLDPVLGCNLKCRMCYFSDEAKRREMHGVFSDKDVAAIARSIFPYVLKLQIGCGAEPTVYNKLNEIVKLGKFYGIGYISMTTNGNLLNLVKLRQLVASGLDEITISLHGIKRETYEYFMEGGDFSKFKQLVEALRQIKIEQRNFKVRVNYTVNEDNVEDLKYFKDMFDGVVDILQIRPIQKIGDSDYSNYSMKKVIENYDDCIKPLVEYCHQNGIVCIFPSLDNIRALSNGCKDTETDNTNALVDMIPYFYLSPYDGWMKKINPYEENLYDYFRREGRLKQLLGFVFTPKSMRKHGVTKSLNYNVD